MNVQVFSAEVDFLHASLDFFLKQYQGAEKTFRLALSGGATPGPFYTALAGQQSSAGLSNGSLDFSKIELYQVDERYVKCDDPESNTRLINETLLKKLAVQPKEFHAIKTNLPIDEAVTSYENQLFDLADHPFDLTVLGMGPDGHIASLFPGDVALKEKKRLVAHTQTPHFKVKDRITLTLPPILKSRAILVLVKGRDKEAVVEELEHGKKSISEFPARALTGHGNCILHFLA